MTDNLQEKIEDKVIDCINLNAGGRLIIFRPEEKTQSVNLVVKRKGEYKTYQPGAIAQSHIVKARVFGAKKEKPKEEVFLYIRNKNEEVNIPKLNAGKNFYVIFVSLNAIKQDIDDDVRIVRTDDKKEFLIHKKNLSKFFLNIILPE